MCTDVYTIHLERRWGAILSPLAVPDHYTKGRYQLLSLPFPHAYLYPFNYFLTLSFFYPFAVSEQYIYNTSYRVT